MVDLESARGAQLMGVGKGHTGGIFADSHAKLFWHNIYCAKPRPDASHQSGSWSCRILGGRAPQIMREYNLAITIEIQPLIQPSTCEMCSSSFAAMSRLEFRKYDQGLPP